VKLVTVGRLISLKRVDGLIRVIARLEDTALVVVGDGPERARLEGLARALGVGGRVYFAGQTTHSRTLSLVAACDALVLNSTHEGFPHVVLEAMSVGVPVIAAAVGGIPEVVRDGENGRLISASDGEALYMAVAEFLALKPEERHRLILGARRTAKEFDFEAMVSETESVLKSVMGTRGG
jgi:glycosyltransferase involved in cell wall biosynthesis